MTPDGVATSETALALRRVVSARPEQVFEALTSAETVRTCCATTPEMELDARNGGRFRLHRPTLAGGVVVVAGTFQEVTPPLRLAFTCIEERDGHAWPTESQVTVTLHRQDPHETELVLNQEQLPDAVERDRYLTAWADALDNLALLLTR